MPFQKREFPFCFKRSIPPAWAVLSGIELARKDAWWLIFSNAWRKNAFAETNFLGV